MSSGLNPIGDPAERADALRAMTTAIREHQQRRDTAGRFERAERAPNEALPAYEVDAEAVAQAIVDRLLSGGTWR